MKKISLAIIPFKKLSETQLANYANKHRLAISVAPGLTNFPDVPYDATALQTLITDYNIALSAAYKGSKVQTGAKDAARENIVTALRANWLNVNQVLAFNNNQYQAYSQQKAFAQTSGFNVNGPSKKAGPLAAPIIRSLTSPDVGVMKILLNAFSKSGKQRTSKIRGAKTYTLNYRTSATPGNPAGPWLQFICSSYIITMTSVPSGTYDVYVEANGASNQKVPTNTRTVTVL